MATKTDYLENLREYTASEIAAAIRRGDLTIYDLSKSGKLTPLMKKRIKEALQTEEQTSGSTPAGKQINTGINLDNRVSIDNTTHDATEVNGAASESVATKPAPTPNTGTATKTAPLPATTADSSDSTTNFLSFKGRIGRLSFFVALFASSIMLAVFSACMAAAVESVHLNMDEIMASILLFIIFLVPGLYCQLAAYSKRLHDLGWSSWCIVALFVPILNTILLFILLFRAGDEDDNNYGPAPK